LVANFTINTYTISASADVNGSISPSGSVVLNYGSSQVFTFTPSAGYHLLDVLVDGVSVIGSVSGNSYTISNVTATHTISAAFQINSYVIAASPNPLNSGVVIGGGTFTYGANVSVTATANTGFTFKNWTEGGNVLTSSSDYSFVATANRTLQANFVNYPPSASNVYISGTYYVCKKLSGHYKYADLEGDAEHGSVYKWYRASTHNLSDTIRITGANDTTYVLTDADLGKYIYFQVTPNALTGTVTGTPVLSSPTPAILKSYPRVTLSTTQSSVCQGQSTSITMAFVGTPPYRLAYTDGTSVHVVTSGSDIYVLPVTKSGVYKGDTLTDNYSCPTTGLTSTVTITVNPLPNPQIVGLNNAYSLNAGPVSLQGSPTGGVFSGDGVVPSSNLFYPSLAGVAGSPHNIVYTYSNPTTGCTNKDTVKVTVINADAFISGLRSSGQYCNYDSLILITGGNSASSIGTFSISGGVGLTDNGDNTATFNPSLLAAGTYVISYTYFNNVSLTISQNITIEQFAAPIILGVNKSLYCSNNSRIQLTTGNYTGGTFSGNGVGKNFNNTYYFDPSLAQPGRASINYLYTTSYGCKVADSVVVQVSQAPTARFEIQNYCWKSDSTIFINLSEPLSNINYWEWHFGDNTAPSTKNKSNSFEPQHLYPLYGDYGVMLIARNNNGCLDTIQKNIHLGDIPVVDFKWKNECYISGVPILFKSLITNSDPIGTYNWVVKDGSNVYQYNTKDIQHTYPSLNSYAVKLVATTNIGCTDSITKTVNLRPVYSLKDSSYFNSFEGGKGFWYPEPGSVNQWVWGTPTGGTINSAYSGTKTWYTSFASSRKNEQLILTSPCFNFDSVPKPYFQSWINTNTLSGMEGAVLQFAVDTVGQWTNIGTLGSGLNWYNDNSIAAAPGGQNTGWSGNSSGWIQARNNLDEINGQNLIRFRMVYGSISLSSAKDGFAFDDVFIGKRSKTVLLEQFTNMSSSTANQANSTVDNILSSSFGDAVGIQYHTSFSGTDSLYDRNQTDPGARVLYYGVGQVPQCYLDGGIDSRYVYDFVTKVPNLDDVSSRALKDADYSIVVSPNNSDGQVSGTVSVKALKDLAYREVSVYIAVVEDVKVQSGTSLVDYNNVLKKMLPTAAGYAINQSWARNAQNIVQYNWTMQYVYDPKKLKIVAFVQDNNSREIYQAISVNAGVLIDDVPNLQNNDNKSLGVILYPNPTSGVAHVLFDKELPAGYTAQIIDQYGRVAKKLNLLQGITEVEMDVSDLASGIYFVRIFNKKGTFKTLKLIVE
jgi:hypothetical protein